MLDKTLPGNAYTGHIYDHENITRGDLAQAYEQRIQNYLMAAQLFQARDQEMSNRYLSLALELMDAPSDHLVRVSML
jgi:hypothetical protein